MNAVEPGAIARRGGLRRLLRMAGIALLAAVVTVGFAALVAVLVIEVERALQPLPAPVWGADLAHGPLPPMPGGKREEMRLDDCSR